MTLVPWTQSLSLASPTDSGASVNALGISKEFIANSTPEQQWHMESFHRTLKTGYIWPIDFGSYEEAAEYVPHVFGDYNNARLPSAIGYTTRGEFYMKWKRQLAPEVVISNIGRQKMIPKAGVHFKKTNQKLSEERTSRRVCQQSFHTRPYKCGTDCEVSTELFPIDVSSNSHQCVFREELTKIDKINECLLYVRNWHPEVWISYEVHTKEHSSVNSPDKVVPTIKGSNPLEHMEWRDNYRIRFLFPEI